ncbi:MAG: glutathione S-transferase family protein [Pseudomonadales bacterium]|nr:glutathione S-transferase family protein [Pseudomonadales bacterium]|tara:strand:- start:799 stop:1407 length:609 start_codon:yes stop_codon:yes gene_type:complete
MIRIYHAPLMRSIRIIWLAEELGLPYEVITVEPQRRTSDAWKAMHPQGKLPVMEDGDLRMIESCAMMQYLLDRYGRGALQPSPGTPEAAHYLQWCWFAESSFARPLGDMAQHTIIRPESERLPAVVEDGRARAEICLGAVEAHMRDKSFLLGDDFSAADIVLGWTLHLASVFDVLTGESAPLTYAYSQRIHARPAAQAALSA